MRLKMVRRLVDVNIIYATQPAQLAKFRKKQEKDPTRKVNVSAQSIRTYIFIGLLYLFLFGILSSANDFGSSPGPFVNMITLFALLAISQGLMSFYNVFYESKDLQFYRPYAFSDAEVIAGKSISVILVLLMALLPMLSYFIILPIQAGGNVLVGLLLGLLCAMILLSILFLGTLFLSHLITKSAVFKKHTSLVSNLIIGLSSLISIGAYLYINMLQSEHSVAGDLVTQPSIFPPIEVFHTFILNPLDSAALVGMLAWVLVLAVLLWLVKSQVLPHFYDAALEVSSSHAVKERVSQMKLGDQKAFHRFTVSYHKRLLSDGTLLTQVIFMMAIFPYLFTFGLFLGASRASLQIENYLTPQYLLPLSLIAFMIGVFNSVESLTSIGISLERENFAYLRALPIDFKRYCLKKFWILFSVQSALPIVLLVGVSCYFGVHPLSLIAMLLIWFLTSLSLSVIAFRRDYKLLTTNWSTVTDLMNRNRGNAALRGLLIFVFIIVMMILIGFAFYLSVVAFTTLIASVIYLLIAAIGTFATVSIYKRTFYKFNQEIGE